VRGLSIPVAAVACAGILATIAWGVLYVRGSDDAVLRGVALGTVLGGGGSVIEALMVHRDMGRGGRRALSIVMIGFGARIVALMALAIILRQTGWADAAGFALSFLGGFLASFPLLGAMVKTGGGVQNGGAHG
jgi:hypothetical protein